MKQIIALLSERGALTAIEIRQALRITHEQVYAGLVWLEAAGVVCIRCARGDRASNAWSLS